MKEKIEKMKVSVDIELTVRAEIVEYADKHCDRNFSMAVRQLIKKGLINELESK